MSDVIDDAQAAEAAFLTSALTGREHAGDTGGQLVKDGVVCCVDCGEPIPPARLKRVPGCLRCVSCQEKADREG